MLKATIEDTLKSLDKLSDLSYNHISQKLYNVLLVELDELYKIKDHNILEYKNKDLDKLRKDSTYIQYLENKEYKYRSTFYKRYALSLKDEKLLFAIDYEKQNAHISHYCYALATEYHFLYLGMGSVIVQYKIEKSNELKSYYLDKMHKYYLMSAKLGEIKGAEKIGRMNYYFKEKNINNYFNTLSCLYRSLKEGVNVSPEPYELLNNDDDISTNKIYHKILKETIELIGQTYLGNNLGNHINKFI